MKIMTINCVYKIGSTGKIIDNIADCLCGKGFEFFHCYGLGQRVKTKNVFKVNYRYERVAYVYIGRLLGLQYNTGYLSTKRVIKKLKKENPDIVHIHCPNSYMTNIYKILEYLGKNKIKTCITHHAEFFYTGNCGHAYDCKRWKTGCGRCPNLWMATQSLIFDRTAVAWTKMKKAFATFEKRNIRMVSVSEWLDQRLHLSPICDFKSNVIHNGIDTTNIFKQQNIAELKKRLEIDGANVILHVTANFSDEMKGPKFIIELANRLINEDIKIIIIDGANSVDRELPSNIIYVGKVLDQIALAQYYTIADLTVLTSKRETFSMVCAESLSCGTPVVGFKAGGPESIAIKEYSEFVEYGDIDALEKCIKQWVHTKQVIGDKLVSKASVKYSKELMAEKYRQVYEELVKG